AHGVLEQVDEVGHVPPPLLRQRPRASRSDPQLRPLLQPPAPAFFAGVYPADHVRTAMRLTVRCPPFRRKSPPRPGRIVDESQAEAIANAMLEPGRRAQEELRRKRLAEAANLAKRRKVAWFLLIGGLLGAGVALLTGHRLSEGIIW